MSFFAKHINHMQEDLGKLLEYHLFTMRVKQFVVSVEYRPCWRCGGPTKARLRDAPWAGADTMKPQHLCCPSKEP